jgi:type IV pilus assembly protein PilE
MNKGFTLIELLVAVMIVAILSAVAVSSYQDYILRAQRADAKSVLLEVAGWIERNYTATGAYNVNPAGAAIGVNDSPVTQSPKTGTARYNISFTAAPTATTFEVRAVPVTADATCGTLSLTQSGEQKSSVAGAAADCWQR